MHLYNNNTSMNNYGRYKTTQQCLKNYNIYGLLATKIKIDIKDIIIHQSINTHGGLPAFNAPFHVSVGFICYTTTRQNNI